MRVRVNNDAGLQSPGLNTDPHCGDLYFDNASAASITTPTAATAITSITAGESFGVTQSAAAGSFTVSRAGIYRVDFALSEIGAVNSQVITLEVYKAGAALSKPIKAKYTQTGTAVAIPTMATQGLVALLPGDVLTLTVIASTGNFTYGRLHFTLIQLTDVAVSPTT